jgi:hypothetical protein
VKGGFGGDGSNTQLKLLAGVKPPSLLAKKGLAELLTGSI